MSTRAYEAYLYALGERFKLITPALKTCGVSMRGGMVRLTMIGSMSRSRTYGTIPAMQIGLLEHFLHMPQAEFDKRCTKDSD